MIFGSRLQTRSFESCSESHHLTPLCITEPTVTLKDHYFIHRIFLAARESFRDVLNRDNQVLVYETVYTRGNPFQGNRSVSWNSPARVLEPSGTPTCLSLNERVTQPLCSALNR
ncbi:hypothetical protein Hamer_G016673 [Homarus americanus]|uniref:Uncharacterized protein n=1 Tax=Homarus americanus TaxID=6706 RepID=A0A8J5NDQ3_HOMAM|nr:hypothetical protein Hamer_G016673 [Homarus americanus]